MIPVSEFLDSVEEIVAESPTYREGGIGKDGTCDCVGLLMGALYRCGKSRYPMHSSNYFARYEIEEVGTEPLSVGMAAFKSRDGRSTLNARYLECGRYDTGDYSDYYHIGVVTSVNPIVITHCTSGNGVNGITTDSKIGNWTIFAKIKGVDYSNETGGETFMKSAVVYSDNGSPVKFRSTPSKANEKNLISKIPVNSVVSAIDGNDEWTKIEYRGKTGYIMTKFLRFDAEEQSESTQDDDIHGELAELREIMLEQFEELKQAILALSDDINNANG